MYDINFLRNKKSKKHLEKLNLKWSYSSSKGHYIGFKATIVLDYDSINPVCILIHSGAPNDTKLFDEILENLQKRRIIRKGDILIFDKGYYSYKNYQLGINKYKIVPFIFPKSSFKQNKLNDILTYPLDVFKKIKRIKHEKRIYNTLKQELLKKTKFLEQIQTKTWKNRRLFQITQTRIKYERNPQIYIKISSKKQYFLNVFLGALIISQGFYSKTAVQQLSEN